MLKQILSDMYVDPELLAELSEEQKQILFFKMRQEQIRRWKEREAAETFKEASRKAHGKSVQWKLGADGDIWVWVMGEHSLDKPYELLCAEILAQRGRQQSVQEAEAVRRNPVEVFTEPSAMLSLHVPSDVQSSSEIQRDKKTERRVVQKVVKTAPAAENARNQEYKQPVTKSRGIEQMLADSISQSRKYGFQQRKEARTTTNETRPREEAVPNHNSDSMQKSEKEDSEWMETLRRSKIEDERRRSLARHARDDYKRLSLQGAHKGKATEASKTSKTREQRPLVPPPLPPKPKNLTAGIANGKPDRDRKQALQRTVSSSSRVSIIQWFKEEQLHLRAGFDKSTERIAPWFHGVLTTKEAEELLMGSAPGSFLIRVSEKIKGYILSYSSAEGCKHFLIDASGDSYSFLGVDQLQHSMLAELVDYHKDEPITSLGKELLRYPCGQQSLEPDYLDLFE